VLEDRHRLRRDSALLPGKGLHIRDQRIPTLEAMLPRHQKLSVFQGDFCVRIRGIRASTEIELHIGTKSLPTATVPREFPVAFQGFRGAGPIGFEERLGHLPVTVKRGLGGSRSRVQKCERIPAGESMFECERVLHIA